MKSWVFVWDLRGINPSLDLKPPTSAAFPADMKEFCSHLSWHSQKSLFSPFWGGKRTQISNCNSSYLSNLLQPVCSNALVQESTGVTDRDRAGKDDPAPEKQGKETGLGVGANSTEPFLHLCFLGGPKEGCLSLMLGQCSQAQGGVFGIILGRDRSQTSMILSSSGDSVIP